MAAENNIRSGPHPRADRDRACYRGFAVDGSKLVAIVVGARLRPFGPINAAYRAALYGRDLVFSFDLCRGRDRRHRETGSQAYSSRGENGVKLLLTGHGSSLKL